jgi:hypothetical protein
MQVELASALSSHGHVHEGMATAMECLASVVTHGKGIKQRNKLQKIIKKTNARLAQQKTTKGSAKGSAKESKKKAKVAKSSKKKKQKR